MKRKNANDLRALAQEINSRPLLTEYLTPAGDGKSFICIGSDCGNGSGEHGTGAVVKDNLLKCGKCQHSYNNIDIIANHLGITTRGKDFIDVIKFGCQLFGLPFEENNQNTEIELIHADIEHSRLQLKDFIARCKNNLWRGLTEETLEKHGCGYIEEWQQIQNIITGKDKFIKSTRRVIIPTADGDHYNAVALDEDRPALDKKYWKIHSGKKHPFGIQFVNEDTNAIIVVEGENDAMSLNQVYGYHFRNAIATCGAGVAKNIATEFFETLDKFFDDKKKPIILILFDNDNAGRNNAKKFCNECVQRGYPTVYAFYSDGDKKVDANDILIEQGIEGLRNATNDLFRRNADRFTDLQKEIGERAKADNFNPVVSFFTPYQYDTYFTIMNGLNDLDHADRFCRLLKFQLGDEIRYMSDLDRWAKFNAKDGIWKVDNHANSSALTPYVKQAAAIFGANAKTDNDKKIAQAYSNSRRFNPVVFFVKWNDLITISSEDLDTYPNLLNLENGVVDLENGKFYQHSPALEYNGKNAYFSQMAKAQWRGLDFRFELLDKSLKEILPDDDDRHAFLMWVAYSFTGESYEEKFLFMDGDGGNGKGTLTKIWLYIANTYGCSFPVEALALNNKFDANAATPALSMLEKARVAISEEIPKGLPLNQAKIKSLTGGDPIPVRGLFEEYHVIQNPTHTLILSGNDLPELSDAKDAGIIRRLRRIKFTQNFRDNPNLQLKKQLLTDEGRAAFIAMVVRHAVEWYKNGLPTSTNMQKAADEYFKSQDFISEFVSEFCTFDRNSSIPRKDFLKRLKEEYPKETRGLSDRNLTAMVEKVDGVSYRRNMHSYAFYGVNWNDAPTQGDFGDNFCPPPNM